MVKSLLRWGNVLLIVLTLLAGGLVWWIFRAMFSKRTTMA